MVPASVFNTLTASLPLFGSIHGPGEHLQHAHSQPTAVRFYTWSRRASSTRSQPAYRCSVLYMVPVSVFNTLTASLPLFGSIHGPGERLQHAHSQPTAVRFYTWSRRASSTRSQPAYRCSVLYMVPVSVFNTLTASLPLFDSIHGPGERLQHADSQPTAVRFYTWSRRASSTRSQPAYRCSVLYMVPVSVFNTLTASLPLFGSIHGPGERLQHAHSQPTAVRFYTWSR